MELEVEARGAGGGEEGMKRGVGEMGLGRRGGEGRAYLVDKLEYHLQANGCLQGRLWIFDNLKSSRWLHFLVEFNNIYIFLALRMVVCTL